MDQVALRDAADRLDRTLAAYSLSNQTAASLHQQLKPFIADARAGRVTGPVDQLRVPGGRLFTETDLRTLPGLEDAFARFTWEISGGETEDRKEIRAIYERRHGDKTSSS